MAVLHIVNQSPTVSLSLHQCLGRSAETDSVLLIEDGVYAACCGCEPALLAAKCKLYVLEEDWIARGLREAPRLSGVDWVDYCGFVALTAAHDRVLSWI